MISRWISWKPGAVEKTSCANGHGCMAGQPLHVLILAIALILGLAVFPALAQDQAAWGDAAQKAVTNPKITNQPKAMEAFTRGNGTGQFIAILVDQSRSAVADSPLRAEAQKAARRESVKAARDKALAAMPDFPQTAIRYRYDNIYAFSVEVTPAQLELLLANPEITTIEPDTIFTADLRQGVPLEKADTYRFQYNGQGLAIAVCDTGIDYTNPHLGGAPLTSNTKVIGGYDVGQNKSDPMDGNGHGTACAGISAGDLGSHTDYIGGVAYGAKLYALKISSTATGGNASYAAMAAAWDWCVTHQNDNPDYPILIITMSFSGSSDTYSSACDADFQTLAASATAANNAGITLFTSTGNNGHCGTINTPSCLSAVNGVGAVYDAAFGTYRPCVDSTSCVSKTSSTSCGTGYYATDVTQADMVTSYSNSAGILGLLAPGNAAFTLGIAGNTYNASFGGTSAATPYAAGAAAVLQSAAKDRLGRWLTPSEVRSKLTSTGNAILDPKSNVTTPRINLKAAIETMTATSSAGFLQVTIRPTTIPTINGLWRVDGGNWHDSGDTISGLAPGSHTVSFKTIPGWSTPANRTVTISNGQTTSSTVAYAGGGASLMPLSIPVTTANPHAINEQFTSNLNNWAQLNGTWTVANGMASVTGDTSLSVWNSMVYSFGSYANFDCSVTMRRSVSSGNTNAMIIRGTPSPLNSSSDDGWYYGYYFGYNNNGSFVIFSLRSWNLTKLVDWTTSSAIKANDWNTLRVVASDSSLTFFINGTQVASITDTALASGQVGVAMYSNGGGTLDVNNVTLTPQ